MQVDETYCQSQPAWTQTSLIQASEGEGFTTINFINFDLVSPVGPYDGLNSRVTDPQFFHELCGCESSDN
jgi:hypothetical protein